MNRLLRYFFQGLLLVVPLGVTLYVVIAFVRGVDVIVYRLIEQYAGVHITVPGLGLVLAAALITLFGWLGSTFLANWLFRWTDALLNRLPLVKIIYTSLKDLLSAFVGDKKKFEHPVVIRLSETSELRRVGFITQPDLAAWHLPGQVAVYVPHSYNFSGNVYLVPKGWVTPLTISGAEAMKFVVSGGVVELPLPEQP
ncbi:DUF502 domain-containing protein [Catalinimonas alkaloidigena]|nr:DUF502 domain-containing protein [Catalinimonas alkaloidigena]